MATATERVPILMSPREKGLFTEKARHAGVSLGEFFRRAAAAYEGDRDVEMLEGMIAQVRKTSAQAERAIDEALAFVEASNARIADMESKKGAR
jgi:hypothetical protein